MRAPAISGPTRAARLDRIIDITIVVGLTVLIFVGFATSYRTLYALAIDVGGYPPWLAPAVPLSFDLGIVVLSLKVVRAAREGRTAPVMRLLVAVTSASTVAVNASAADSFAAAVLHAVPPAMFVICFENVIISARRDALRAMGLLPAPLPRLGVLRWVLSPWPTWTSWRNLVLKVGEKGGWPEVAPVSAADVGLRRDSQSSGPELPRSDRADVVADILTTSPGMAAPELARQMGARGHTVSVRTAQR